MRHRTLVVAAVALVSLSAAGSNPRSSASPGAAPNSAPSEPGIPPIVLVSRNPPAGGPGVIPGLGPSGRTLATGGRLLVREPGGAVRELLPARRLYDVSDPCVSPDGRAVAFAGTIGPDSVWRIWRVGIEGGVPVPVTGAGEPSGSDAPIGTRRYDDFDPCWLDDSTICFASTSYPQIAQYGGAPASNLFLIRIGGGPRQRLTSERNGAEEPAYDFARGRIVFSRWWYNRWRASTDSAGPTVESARAMKADTVNLWQAMEVTRAGADERLACGKPAASARIGGMAYQPALLADGSIVAVYAANSGLSPGPGGAGVQRFAPRLAAGKRLAGAIVDPGARAGYGSPSGLAPTSACAPAGLPDGRLVFAFDPGGRGDFGLYVMNADGTGLRSLLDLPGTLELDPAPVRKVPARAPAAEARTDAGPPAMPFATLDQVLGHPRRFRYLDLDVFAPPGPAVTTGARIRFYTALSRPEAAGGDTIALVREAQVGPGGKVDEAGLPADVPMFEEIVDRQGMTLRGAHGPAHVAGLNVGPAGGTSRCSGCHVGHSTRVRAR